MRRKLPLVFRFHHGTRAVAVQPRQRGGVIAQIRVPECRGQRENHTMMIRIARLLVTRQRAVGEDGMFRVVQHHFIFWRAHEIRIHREARFHAGIADGCHVLGPGHQQPRNFHRAKRRGRAAGFGRAGSERNRRRDARIGETLAAGKPPLRDMLRAWAIVYIGNFIGAVGTALLVFLSGQYLAGHGTVAAVALKIASDKTALPFAHVVLLGILCNVLVCLAVWLSFGARTTTDKVLAVLFPVSAFVAAGFEHSVANMYFIPLGLFMKAWGPAEMWSQIGNSAAAYAGLTWPAFFLSLIPVTIGNIIGGGGVRFRSWRS